MAILYLPAFRVIQIRIPLYGMGIDFVRNKLIKCVEFVDGITYINDRKKRNHNNRDKNHEAYGHITDLKNSSCQHEESQKSSDHYS